MPAISPRRLRFCSRLMLTSILIYTYTRAASCQPGLCPWSRPARRGSSVDHQRAFVLACSLKGQQASNPSISILLSCLLLLLFFLLLESQRFFLHPLTCQKNIGGSCSSAFDFLNRHSLLAALKYLLNNSFVFYSLENETVCFFLKDRKFLWPEYWVYYLVTTLIRLRCILKITEDFSIVDKFVNLRRFVLSYATQVWYAYYQNHWDWPHWDCST